MINAMINIFSQVKPSYTEEYHKSYRELTTIQTKILNITLPYPLNKKLTSYFALLHLSALYVYVC